MKELYDLRTDPGETRNLAEELPDLAEHLRRKMRGYAEALEKKARERELMNRLDKLKFLLRKRVDVQRMKKP